MAIVVIIILGLLVGSFLNALTWRLGNGESVLRGRSHCPHCRHVLAPVDLIPVFSFLLLAGRCRYCRQPISWRYPAIELATVLGFLACNSVFGLSWEGVVAAVFFCFLLVIFVYDLEHLVILDRVVLPAAGLSLVAASFPLEPALSFSLTGFTSALIGGILGLSFFYIQYLLSHGRWVGGGDLRLGLFAGFLLGPTGLAVCLLVTYCVGSIIGAALVVTKRKTWKSQVPLAAFMAPAIFIVLLWGDRLTQWYLNLFL